MTHLREVVDVRPFSVLLSVSWVVWDSTISAPLKYHLTLASRSASTMQDRVALLPDITYVSSGSFIASRES